MLKTNLLRRTQSAKYRIRRWFAGCVVALFSLASTSVGATTIDFTFTGAVQTFVVPNLVSTRCTKCRVNLLVLVSSKREVLAVTEK